MAGTRVTLPAHNPDRNAHCPDIKRCCGRPPALDILERRDIILDAAEIVLQEQGYHGASMDRIARQAGMSKKTLYQSFESKHLLFKTLIEQKMLGKPPMIITSYETLGEQLSESLVRLADHLLQPQRLCLLRTVIAETAKAPEFSQLSSELFEYSCETFPIRTWLREQCAAGLLSIDNMETKADILFGMTLGFLMLSELVGCRRHFATGNVRQFIDEGVKVFLEGVVVKTRLIPSPDMNDSCRTCQAPPPVNASTRAVSLPQPAETASACRKPA